MGNLHKKSDLESERNKIHFYFKIEPRLCSKDLQNACGPRRRFEYSQIN